MIDQNNQEHFDRYGRYYAIAKIVEVNRTRNNLKILDVGGFGGLIETLLPQDQITVLDVIDENSPHAHYVRADALAMPFKNRQFDFVISSDTLEHIPSKNRMHFLEECFRVSKGFLIIGAPFDTEGVAKAEKNINDLYRTFSHKNYQWLEEHQANGLPSLKLLDDFAKLHNLKSFTMKNNQLDEWSALISHYMITESIPSPEGIKDFYKRSDIYNKTNNRAEVKNTAYRHIVALGINQPVRPILKKNHSNYDFASYVPAFKAIKSYLNSLNGPVDDHEYREASIAVGAYRIVDNDYSNMLEIRLATAENELNTIRLSRSWRLIVRLRSHPFYCKAIRIAWRVIKLIRKVQGYKVYLYPPNLFWRLSTGIPAYGRRKFNKLSFKQILSPDVSIVIPVYGKPDLTLNCLVALTKVVSKYSFEVIVVDDHSKGSTPHLFSRIPGLHFIRNEQNEGFVISCNNGAKIAKGKYLVFLNNDTLVDHNWLNPLIERLDHNPKVGLVGSKLVYPNGVLQEAGGIIFSDGSGWNYGRMGLAESFEYSYARDVDYCSGASIAVTRSLFWQVGGFDTRYAPAYYEDTDLAFTIRDRGYRVVYEPLSKVTHLEGASSGTDLTQGMKRFQLINQKKFVQKWHKTLQEEHYSSPIDLIKARDRSNNKMALIIDHYVPEPDRDSGSKRMFGLIKIVQDLGYKVTFWPQNLLMQPKYTQALQNQGVEVVYGAVDFVQFARQRNNLYDLVMMSRPSVAPAYMDTVRSFYRHATVLYDTVDLTFLRLARQAKLENDENIAILAENWKKVELGLMQRSDGTLVVSQAEEQIIKKLLPNIRIGIVSNIHDLSQIKNIPFGQRRGLLFIGGFMHQPNTDAMVWFCKEIMPSIIKLNPEIILRIIGSNPPQEILKLASRSIKVMGYVENVDALFNSSRVFISPLRYGAGVKGKINQAMEYGLPVVGTSISFEGMHMKNQKDCIIADDPDSFVSSIVSIYSNEQLWNSISVNSRKVLVKYFSPSVSRKSLQKLLKEIV